MSLLSDFIPVPPFVEIDYSPAEGPYITALGRAKNITYLPSELTEEQKRAVTISQKSPYPYLRVFNCLQYLDERKVDWFHLSDDYLAQNLLTLVTAAAFKEQLERAEYVVKEEIKAVQVGAIIDRLAAAGRAASDRLDRAVNQTTNPPGNRHARRKQRSRNGK